MTKVKVKCERPILLKGGIKKIKGDVFVTSKDEIEPFVKVNAVTIIEEEKKTRTRKKSIKNANKQDKFEEKVVTK